MITNMLRRYALVIDFFEPDLQEEIPVSAPACSRSHCHGNPRSPLARRVDAGSVPPMLRAAQRSPLDRIA
jgi:hypothetical protein